MEKKDVFQRLAALAETEDRVAVATIVRAYGSTPREVGAKMIVLESGDIIGTVGGGCGEADVWQEAKRLFRDGRPRSVHVDLTEDPDKGGDAICGGRMDVFVDLWDREEMRLGGRIVDLMDHGQGVSLATVMSGDDAGRHLMITSQGIERGSLGDDVLDASLLDEARAGEGSQVRAVSGTGVVRGPRRSVEGAVEVFLEVIEEPPVLVIAGAGHCALPLSRMGKMLGFQVVVLDDRPECATRERFPDADRILLGDLEAEVERIPMTAGTYLVLVTRGHKLDETILRRVIREPLAYIGMIGSKRRVSAVFRDMERDGYERELLDRVHSPIGLDIRAETPEEIAVCILAEIIMVRKGGTGRPLSRIRQG